MEKKKNLPPLRADEQRLSYEDSDSVAVTGKIRINPGIVFFIVLVLLVLFIVMYQWQSKAAK